MITERDIGKRCRLVSKGAVGEKNIADKGEEILGNVYEIKAFDSDGSEDFVIALRIFPTLADYTTSFFLWRVELEEDEELTVLT